MERNFYRDGDLQVRMALWDKDLSQRHRDWGQPCQAMDLDQIVSHVPSDDEDEVSGTMLVETYCGQPYALVEYKHERGLLVPRSRYMRQWQVYVWIADRCAIPAFCAFYRREDYAIYIIPLNENAKGWCKRELWVSEASWVSGLYRIRGLRLSQEVRCLLHTTKPEKAVQTNLSA